MVFKSHHFLLVMIDETTDKSYKEQLSLVIRWVSNDLQYQNIFEVIQFICYWCTKYHASHERCLLMVSNPLCKVVWAMLWWVQYYGWNKSRGWPQFARWRKAPRQFEQEEIAATPKDEYRWVYFEALDLVTTSICSRFHQKGFKIFSNVQQLWYFIANEYILKSEKRRCIFAAY